MNDSLKQNQDKQNIPEQQPELVPPDAREEPQTNPNPKRLFILFLGLCLVGTALLILFWPFDPVNRQLGIKQAGQEETSAKLKVSPPTQGNAASAGDDQLNELLELWSLEQAKAESERIALWGGEDYSRAVAKAKSCNRLFRMNRFAEAKNACQGALEILTKLRSKKETLLKDALSSGDKALEQGDPKQAVKHFERVLAIAPENAQGVEGLRRANQLPKVLQLMKQGVSLADSGNLRAAQEPLEQAVLIDPNFPPAQKELERIKVAITNADFQMAMSRALQALDENRLKDAEAAIEVARALRPQSPALLDAQKRLYWVKRGAKMADLRKKASDAERDELWQEALTACKEALALEPEVAFALSCRERASYRLNLDRALRFILEKPDRLFELGPLKEARQVYAEAQKIDPSGPVLSEQLRQVNHLIKQAEAEVAVVIKSDNLTEVSIYHVGRLGRFLEKKLVLRTGDYIATGSRDGYRDVRKVLKVRPDSKTLTFSVSCREPI